MKTQIIGVLGLGIFGQTIATELSSFGQDVIALDNNSTTIDSLADQVTKAAVGDITDIDFLRSAGIDTCDSGIIATGENLERVVALVPGRYTIEGVYKTTETRLNQTINIKSENISMDLDLDAGYTYSIAMYLYSPEERQEYELQSQIDEIVDFIAEYKRDRDQKFTVKQLEKTKKGLEAKLKKLKKT